jgi:hypothetical protein
MPIILAAQKMEIWKIKVPGYLGTKFVRPPTPISTK